MWGLTARQQLDSPTAAQQPDRARQPDSPTAARHPDIVRASSQLDSPDIPRQYPDIPWHTLTEGSTAGPRQDPDRARQSPTAPDSLTDPDSQGSGQIISFYQKFITDKLLINFWARF